MTAACPEAVCLTALLRSPGKRDACLGGRQAAVVCS